MGEDRLRWDAAPNGAYSAKIGYNMLSSSAETISKLPQNLCWNKVCLPKAGIFTWAADQGRILTGDRFIKLGYHGPTRCLLCQEAKETVNHLLLNCTFT